jgi:hypothetical protein
VNDKELLGYWPKDSDYDEIIDEDCDVYGPDGDLLIAFRKEALDYVRNITEEQREYWRWVSRCTPTSNRGLASGKEITDKITFRLTEGQNEALRGMIKGDLTTPDQVMGVANAKTSNSVYCVLEKATIKAGYIDVEAIEGLNWKLRRKKKLALPQEEIDKLLAEKMRLRQLWFERWVRQEWDLAEDTVAAAKAGKKKYISSQTRGNQDYSVIVGAFDRVIRQPYGRLTKPTTDRYEDFIGQKEFYQEVERKLEESHPEGWIHLKNKFGGKVTDPRFSLFGDCFTTITVNYNYQVAYHYDGNNCPDAVAVLTTIDGGSYEGYEFILPQIRLGFAMKNGDVFIGDNQGLMHGMTPMRNATPDAESIWFVFYSREGILDLESYDVECCRKGFLEHSKQNLKDECGEDKANWIGLYPEMWKSPQWEEYKAIHCPEATNTNAKGS